MDPLAFDQDTQSKMQRYLAQGYSQDSVMREAVRYQSGKARNTMQPQAPAEPAQNKWASWLPMLGALGGAFLPIPGGPIVGGAIGSALGAGAGTLGKQMLQDTEPDLGEVGREAGFAGITGGIGGAAGKVIGKLAGGISGKSAQALLNTSPAQFDALSKAGINANQALVKWGSRIGFSGDDALGTIAKGKPTGKLYQTLAEVEKPIQDAVRGAGSEIIAAPIDIIAPLEREMMNLSQTVGNQGKVEGIKGMIDEIFQKYPDGFTAEDLLNLKRQADSRFGKAVVEDTAGAVTTQAQKKIANTARDILHKKIPQIGQGLDDQSELLALEPLFSRARAKESAGALGVNGLDLSKPGTWMQTGLRTNVLGPLGGPTIGELGARMPVPGDAAGKVLTGIGGAVGAGAGGMEASNLTGGTQPPGQTGIPQPPIMANLTSAQTPESPQMGEQDMLRQVVASYMFKNAKNVGDLAEAYKLLYPEQKDQKRTAKQGLFYGAAATAQEALNLLNSGQVSSGLGQGLMGGLGEKLGWNSTTQQEYRSKIALARTVAKNAMIGANMTEREMESLSGSIPDYDDAPNTAQAKLQSFITEMQRWGDLQQGAESSSQDLFSY